MKNFYPLDLFRIPLNLSFGDNRKVSTCPGVIFSFGIYIFFFFALFQSDMYQRQNPYVISQTLTSSQTLPIQLTDKNLMGYVLTDMNGKYIYDPSLFYFELRKFNYKLDSNGIYQVAYYDSEVLKPCKSSITFTNESVCFTNKSLYLNGSSNSRDYHIFTVSIFLCNNKTSNGTCKSKEEILKFFSTPKFFACHLPGVEIDVKDYEDPMKVKRTASYYLIDPTLRKRNYIYLKQVELFSDEGWIIEDKNYFKDFKLDYQTMDFNTRVEGDPLYQYLFFASFSHDLVNRRYQRLPEFLGSFSGTTQLIIIISGFFVDISIYVKSLKNILNSLYTFPSPIKNKKKKKLKLSSKAKKNSKFDNKKTLEIGNKNKEDSVNNFHNKNSDPKLFNLKENEVITKTLNQNSDLKNSEINKEKLKPIIKSESLKLFNIDSSIPKKIIHEDSFKLEHYSSIDVDCEQKQKIEMKIEMNKLSTSIKELFQKPKKTKIFEEILEKKKNSDNLSINIVEYIIFKIRNALKFKNTQKENLIKKAENTFKEELDLIKILSKIQEIEKIKILLMNDDQLRLFNLLSKPACFVNQNEIEESRSLILSKRMSVYKTKESKENLMTHYKNVLTLANTDEFSKRLINLVDKNVLELNSL